MAYSWGMGEYGALGIGSSETMYFPSAMRLPEGFAAVDVSCGARHTAIILKDHYAQNVVYTCGAGDAG